MKNLKQSIHPALWFALTFLSLFGLLYAFYLFYLGITAPGGLYIAFLNEHLNFISGLRYLLIEGSAYILNLLGHTTKTTDTQMLVVGHNIVHVGYDCLGFGVMIFFVAFVITYPAGLRSKICFGVMGLVVIQLINLARFIILSLYWKRSTNIYLSDHHTIFNIIVYIIIGISLYFYIRYQDKAITKNASN